MNNTMLNDHIHELHLFGCKCKNLSPAARPALTTINQLLW